MDRFFVKRRVIPLFGVCFESFPMVQAFEYLTGGDIYIKGIILD